MVAKEIHDPLALAEHICRLKTSLQHIGTSLTYSSDAALFKAVKRAARDEAATPFFDPETSRLEADRFFWMHLVDNEKATVALQAFRLDVVADSLATWAPILTIGLYMNSGEFLIPSGKLPLSGSAAEHVSGRLVYHGELWIRKNWRIKGTFNSFTRLGLLLATAKWNPDGIWALTSPQMATHGHPIRMGYPYVEPGFLRWNWQGDKIPAEEWLLLADRNALARLADGESSLD